MIPARFRGIASMLAATAAFVANDTCLKLAMSDVPPMQVLVMRGLAAITLCLPLLMVLKQTAHVPHVVNRWVLARCFGEIAALGFFIYGLKHMAISDITAIAQTTPLLVLAAGAVIWKDHLGLGRMALVGLGIAGALLVAQPGSDAASPWAMLGFGAALGGALRDILSRKVDPAIPALIVTFATLVTVMLSALCGMLLMEVPVTPAPRSLMLTLAAGVLLIAAHFFIFLAYRLSPPRVVAPFNYAFTIWAVLSSLLVFDVVPNALALAGMGLILCAGLAVILTERRTTFSSPVNNAQVISN